jgi:hypothetical protein
MAADSSLPTLVHPPPRHAGDSAVRIVPHLPGLIACGLRAGDLPGAARTWS